MVPIRPIKFIDYKTAKQAYLCNKIPAMVINFKTDFSLNGEKGAEVLSSPATRQKELSLPTNFLPDVRWEKTLTDPANHINDKFRYLVHAVKLPEERFGQLLFISDGEQNGQISHNHIDIELLKEPTRIVDKPIISTSLIDEKHTDTWTGGGFILKVPRDNILKAASQDIGAPFWGNGETIKKLYKERDTSGIMNPEEILNMTHPDNYNDIVITGTGRDGKRVEIIGIFIKVSFNGEPKHPKLAWQLNIIAERNKLPIIYITDNFSPYIDSNPAICGDDFKFAFNRGGKRYLFNTKSNCFEILEELGTISRLMTPNERAEAVRIIDEFLLGSQNPTLKTLVEKVKTISDREIEERAMERRAYQIGRIYYKDELPETLETEGIAIQKDLTRYVVDKDGMGWAYTPSVGTDIVSRRMSGEEIADFMRQVELRISTNPENREQLEKAYKMISGKLSMKIT